MPVIIEEYYEEMAWDCVYCKFQNLGRDKICFKCGKPLERNEFHDQVDRPTRVETPKLLAQAADSPDWECRFCRSHQQRGNGECAVCGAGKKLSNVDLTPYEEDMHARPEIHPDPPSPEIVELRQNERRRKELSLKKGRQFKAVASIILAIAFVIFIVLLIVWALTPKYVDAKISDVYYQHIAHVEKKVIVTEHGFSPDLDAFDVEKDGEKIDHYDTKPDGFTNESCQIKIKDPDYCYTTKVVVGEPICVSQKSGFKKCTKVTTGGDRQCDPRSHIKDTFCKIAKTKQVPAYRKWYTWKLEKWIWNRSIPESGHTNEVKWPSDAEINLADNGLERCERHASYTITFSSKKDSWKYTPSSLHEYQELKIGSVHRLKIVAGSVTVLQ